MPGDYVDIGPVPSDESCEGVGTPEYDPEKARQECTRFLNLIRKTCGDEPMGARLAIMSNPHDFGSYYSVVCYYDDLGAKEYAGRCEDEAPTEWPDEDPSAAAPEPRKIDINRVMDAVQADDGTGFCLACGEQSSGCEPDARNYECDSCGQKQVFGAEELLLMGIG